ncbi:MAG: sulfur oxidation c-type cytochrome SoxA [Gammaproteobacteria bacterium]|nr:sulfur oxidation c-type cytochrome SoxA [Gammaproteobacteria bacterium]
MRFNVRALLAGTVALGVATAALAAQWGDKQVEDRRSGYTYAKAETRAIQDDEFENPGMLWVERGSGLWSQVDGKEGKACESCHGDAGVSMANVGNRYPVFARELGKLINTEQRINQCRTERMGADAWKWESGELLSMTSFVRHQSAGKPLEPVIDGVAQPFFEKGKAFYEQRRGQLDMACMHCHQFYPGGQLRANILSQGQGNGFPVYRLKWQKVGSLHRRFRGCNSQVRAKPYPYGADEYVNLELYVAWRGRGLPVETPAVRN